MNLTIEEKYNWLLSKMQVTDLDYFESDGLLRLEPIYFQMDRNGIIPSKDQMIQDEIAWEKKQLLQNDT